MNRTDEQQRRLTLLWTGAKRGTRGRKPGLALADLVRAGIALADNEGLEAVSMARVARELGTGVMSLYRYVPGKAELVDLMVDTVLGELPYPVRRPPGWRRRLEAAARREWAIYGRHPWVLSRVASMRLPMGPNMVRSVEWMMSAVEPLSRSARRRLELLMIVTSFVQGAGLLLARERDAARRREPSLEQFWEAKAPDGGADLGAAGAPALARVMSGMREPIDLDAWFELGLRRTLDGIAAGLRRGPPAR
jgi:AcrR family transcriptional regulator